LLNANFEAKIFTLQNIALMLELTNQHFNDKRKTLLPALIAKHRVFTANAFA
jgi:hypothetical protein